MGQPYVGEIRMFGGNFAPAGWAFCNGQAIPISEYEVLYALIGTTYGGDGITVFNLPDLRGRVPIHQGQGPSLSNRVIGAAVGSEEVALNQNQLPSHSHAARAQSKRGNTNNPSNAVWAASSLGQFSGGVSSTVKLRSGALSLAGLGIPHNNMMPYVGVSFIISLFGVFPSPS